MIRWTLLQQRSDGTWIDTHDEVEADSWGAAVELLLAFELCATKSSKWGALEFDVALGMTPPALQIIRLNGGDYKIVPSLLDEITADAAAIVEGLRNRGVL